MTFYEAALRVLEEAKRPLTHAEITQLSVAQNLLSHIGKTPELTMLSRLAAMARRPRDRRVLITAKDTFALTEWQLPEDPEAAATTGVPEANPEEDLPPYRPIERHPEPRSEYVRAIGRQGDRDRKSRRDDERRRKYPPIAEVAFEQLTDHGAPLTAKGVLEKARAKELISDELSVEQLLHSLLDDNQKRIDSGRRPQFAYVAVEGSDPEIQLDASETPGAELQLAFATLAGVPVENGRPVLKVRRAAAEAGPTELTAEDAALITAAKQAGKDAKRAMARVLRKKLSELDGGTLEKSIVRMMHELNFREVKVAKRSKEGPLLTARRREGSLELRYAIRIVKGTQSVERRQVQELRRDLGHYGAHVGLIASSGEARGDARTEALERGAMIFLWCGEGLAERFFEAQVGVKVQTIELYDVDEAFFAKAQVDAEAAKQRRDERREERRDREGQGEASPAAPSAPRPEGDDAPVAAEPQANLEATSNDEGDDEEGDDEGEGEGGQGGQPGQQGPVQLGPDGQPLPRKRRRRRRRRGRGNRPEGAPGQPGQPGAPAEAGAAAAGDAPAAAGDAPPAPSEGGEAPAAAAAPSDAPAQSVPPPLPTPPSGGDAGQ